VFPAIAFSGFNRLGGRMSSRILPTLFGYIRLGTRNPKYKMAGTSARSASARAIRVRTVMSQRPFQSVAEIGLFPRKATVLVHRAAEMTVSGGAAIDRPVQLQRAADIGRRQPEHF